jgi:polar amino acid transport system permease protein
MTLFQPVTFFHYLLSPTYATAAGSTLAISLSALLVGLAVGLILAVLRETRIGALAAVVSFYLWLFRGTPVLLQIVFAFNVLPSFGVVLPGFACAVLALGLNEGAYMAEIMRAGILAVGEDQRDAGRALGLSEGRIMRLVVLPQAFRIIIPPIGNQFIGMLKLSALVSVIGVRELLLVADQSASYNFRYLEALSAAAIYYLVLTNLFMAVQRRVERLLERRPADASERRAPLRLGAASMRGDGGTMGG